MAARLISRLPPLSIILLLLTLSQSIDRSSSSIQSMSASSSGSRRLNFMLLVPAARHKLHLSLEQIQPAVALAIESARERDLFSGMAVDIVANDSMCDYKIAPVVAILQMRDIDLLLGPYCSFCVAAIARYNRFVQYRKPIVTSGGIASHLTDKVEYYNLVRVGYNYEVVEQMLLDIFRHYNWLPRSVQTVLLIELPDEDSRTNETRDEIGVTQGRILSQGIERCLVKNKYIVRRLHYEVGNVLFEMEIFRVLRDEVRRKIVHQLDLVDLG